jgi:hypothetical protein
VFGNWSNEEEDQDVETTVQMFEEMCHDNATDGMQELAVARFYIYKYIYVLKSTSQFLII